MKKISLSKNNDFALVDESDFEWLNRDKWHLDEGYAVRTCYAGRKCKVYMHRAIMGAFKPGIQVDHINQNKLDNRRCNLRFCTNAQNKRNQFKRKGVSQSKFKGVYFKKHLKLKPWVAQIRLDGKLIHLGCYAEEWAAAIAYNTAAVFHYGEFACLNQI
jgi:hypothetical protein